MKYVLGGIWIVICLWVLVAMVAGRVKLRSCCPADPARDRRMSDAGDVASPTDTSAADAIGGSAREREDGRM